VLGMTTGIVMLAGVVVEGWGGGGWGEGEGRRSCSSIGLKRSAARGPRVRGAGATCRRTGQLAGGGPVQGRGVIR